MGRRKARRPSPKQFRAIKMARPQGFRTQRPTCPKTGKIRYATSTIAHNVTADVKGTRRSYQCRHCGGWHTTSTPFKANK